MPKAPRGSVTTRTTEKVVLTRARERPKSMPFGNRALVILYKVGFGWLVGKQLLLLTTVGRKSGRKRTTPLGYVQSGKRLFVLSGFGREADWVQNLLAEPTVWVQVKGKRTEANARPVDKIAEKVQILKLFEESFGKRAEQSYGIPPGASDEILRQIAMQRMIIGFTPKT